MIEILNIEIAKLYVDDTKKIFHFDIKSNKYDEEQFLMLIDYFKNFFVGHTSKCFISIYNNPIYKIDNNKDKSDIKKDEKKAESPQNQKMNFKIEEAKGYEELDNEDTDNKQSNDVTTR